MSMRPPGRTGILINRFLRLRGTYNRHTARTILLVPPTSEFSTYTPVMTSFHNLKAELPTEGVYDFAQLKGKTVLIVNTASGWCVFYGGVSRIAEVFTSLDAVVH
jgi:hypothetical protein